MLAQPSPNWASCPIPQNRFITIISQPSYPGAISIRNAFALLRATASTEHHQFWPGDVSLLDSLAIDPAVVAGAKQVTDLYLLALAVKHDGRLVALDRSIPLTSVRNAQPRHLVIL